MTNFICGENDLVKCLAIDCLLIPACVGQLTISKVRLVSKLRVYCRNAISSLWYLAINSLWQTQHSALLESRATFRKWNALRRVWMLYAVERCTVTEFRALCLPMNAICRSAALLLKCVLIVYTFFRPNMDNQHVFQRYCSRFRQYGTARSLVDTAHEVPQ